MPGHHAQGSGTPDRGKPPRQDSGARRVEIDDQLPNTYGSKGGESMACACEKDRGRGNKCEHCKNGKHVNCSYFGRCS